MAVLGCPLFAAFVSKQDLTPWFVLGVSLDELAGRKGAPDEARIKNHELHQLVREVDQLPDQEQQALILVIDSMVKRAKINRMASSGPRKRATSSARAGR